MPAHPHDTIVAVSSPPGRSPRGLIRVSGPGVQSVLEHVLDHAAANARELTPVRLRRPGLPALLLRFTGPASYTGEDLAELQLPGSAALLDRVLHDMIAAPAASARLAEPGEFTFRAYTAGKLDLTQAEGIGATIAAVSDSQLAAAGLLRRGTLGKTAETLVDQLGSLLALVESGIDFTDQEDVTPISPDHLQLNLARVGETISRLLTRSRSWSALEALPRVVLVGPPSAGKSTLFNALLGRERSVIDAAPGTTRDALAEPLQLNDADGRPVEVMLVDLAGLDEALLDHALLPDQQAQHAAREVIRQADLIVRISDKPGTMTALDTTTASIDVLSKADHPQSSDPQQLLPVSAHTGAGLDALRRTIVAALAGRSVSMQADLLALQPRHESALRQAAEQLRTTHETLAPALGSARLNDIELLADSMRNALDALASLGGRLTPDEVIGRVFATFCVGK